MANANVVMCGYVDRIMDSFVDQKGQVNHSIKLSCVRDSGRFDVINLVIPEHVLETVIIPGMKVSLTGYVRSRNYKVNEKSHLAIEVVAKTLDRVADSFDSENAISIDEAYIVKPVIFRTSPLGRDICDLIIAVNSGRYSNYIPCIAWGKMAKSLSNQCSVGTKLSNITGRLQSREYQKTIQTESGSVTETRTAYELSIKSIGGIQ